MTDTLNKPVKDEVGDERGATKHNQGPSKYEKETNIAGDGLCFGARNVRNARTLSQLPTSPSLFRNQTSQIKLEQSFNNSTEVLKTPPSTLSNSSSPGRILRPSTGGHIPMGPAAAAISASVCPFRYPLAPLPIHSSGSKMPVLNSDSSAFVPLSQQQHLSSIGSTSSAFSPTDATCSRTASCGVTVNSSPNTSLSVPLHSVMTSALSTIATTTTSAPRLSETAPSQPSFPLIHSTGAFHLPGSAMSPGSLVVRQPTKAMGIGHNSSGTVVSNPSGSKCSSSVAGLGLIPVTAGFPSSEASVVNPTNKIGIDVRPQHLPSLPSVSLSAPNPSSHNHRKERSTENPLGVDKFNIPGLEICGGQCGIGSNSSNAVLAYSDVPVSFQPSISSTSKSSASSLTGDFNLSGHTFFNDRSGISGVGSSGNLIGSRQQRGQVGQQIQQQTQPLPSTLFGLARPTIANSQPGSISPSASPRPAPTILRKRTNDG